MTIEATTAPSVTTPKTPPATTTTAPFVTTTAVSVAPAKTLPGAVTPPMATGAGSRAAAAPAASAASVTTSTVEAAPTVTEAPLSARPTAGIAERPGRCLPGWAAVLACLTAVGAMVWMLWRIGALPARLLFQAGLPLPAAWSGNRALAWCSLWLFASLAVFAVGGLTRGRAGRVWVLTRCGAYQGTVRRTGLLWISPLLIRRPVDVTLRHWRSRPIEAVDAHGIPLQVSVLIVWRVRDTARAVFAVDDHALYLREQVESAVARVFSRLPVDDFDGRGPTLRDSEGLGDRLTTLLADDLRPVGVEVFSAQPVWLEYAPEVATAMRRAQTAALDDKHRKAVLDDVLTSVADTVRGLTERGLVQLDDYERKALVKDLTVAFYTARGPAVEPLTR